MSDTQVVTVNELTQGMAESLIDNLPTGEMTAVKYQGAFINAALAAGWIAFEPPLPSIAALPRAEATRLYAQLHQVWQEANGIPNA